MTPDNHSLNDLSVLEEGLIEEGFEDVGVIIGGIVDSSKDIMRKASGVPIEFISLLVTCWLGSITTATTI
jgi:hypothetical protein